MHELGGKRLCGGTLLGGVGGEETTGCGEVKKVIPGMAGKRSRRRTTVKEARNKQRAKKKC